MTSTQTSRNLVEDGRTVLAAQGDPEALRRVIPASVRLLAGGEPVSTAQIADAAALPLDRVEAALRGVPDVEWTADGRVEGFGLTRRPTQHKFRVGDAEMYTWCAMDTLIFAAVLDRPAQIESPDGATGTPLRLETDGRRIVAADPPSIVVSWFFDPAGTGFRACDQVPGARRRRRAARGDRRPLRRPLRARLVRDARGDPPQADVPGHRQRRRHRFVDSRR